MNTTELIDKIFNRLDDWRHLPSYQLERRADIFFSIYLDEIIKEKFNQKTDFIIPEFPVRLGHIYPNINDRPNQSFKIDYLVICDSEKKVYFVELKTDNGSNRKEQLAYLKLAKELNIKGLVNGIIDISKATNSKRKYSNLLTLLTKMNWIDASTLKPICENYEIEIVFIQPTIDSVDKNIISFAEIIKFLENKDDEITKRFVQSLNRWAINPNK